MPALREKINRVKIEAWRVSRIPIAAATVVYQGHAGGLSPNELWALGRYATAGLTPDWTLILDLPVERAVVRRGREADRMESRGLEYLEQVRQGFLKEAAKDSQRFRVVDASPDVQKLHQQVVELVRSFLNDSGSTAPHKP